MVGVELEVRLLRADLIDYISRPGCQLAAVRLMQSLGQGGMQGARLSSRAPLRVPETASLSQSCVHTCKKPFSA